MKHPSNIAHPLKNRKGTSQKDRLIQALDPNAVPIDGKTLADRLYMISGYAQQINFYQYRNTEIDGEFQDIDNWGAFFKDSLPFQLAVLSKIDVEGLEVQFSLLYKELNENPSKETLEALFNFIEAKLSGPTTQLFITVQNQENSFTDSLLAIIKTSFAEAMKSFIGLHNSSVNYLCVSKKNFNEFLNLPWQFEVIDIYAIDGCIQKVKKGKKEALLKAGAQLNTLFLKIIGGVQAIVDAAPNYIEESLLPLQASLQKKHEPHIALLFAFLELFKHFQGNINELSKKHLDFFYEEVLKMLPKDALPDQAHIVFEVANHQEQYLLKKDLLLKDSKDANNQDIQFGLDHELVVDKAQVKEVRTLSLFPTTDNNDKTYIEGVYIAPVANSADGKGKKFKEDQPVNWATLGDKYSKYIKKGKEIAEEHPKARIGFVLASPVLLLEEGERSVEIRLNCNLPEGSISAANIKQNLDEIIAQKQFSFKRETVENCETITEETKNYLLNLLGNEEEYIIGNNLEVFLTQKDPISCLPLFNDNEKKRLCECAIFEENMSKVGQLFLMTFSGEKDWVIPKQEEIEDLVIDLPPFSDLNTSADLQFVFKLKLKKDDPKVVFFDEEKLKEKIDVNTPFPVVKIELNPAIEKLENVLTCDDIIGGRPKNDDKKDCCLKREKKDVGEISISPYHFLQGIKLVDAKIKVHVCGLKNLIVQNDENLQDVNKPMFPFGPRPKVDASFIIGSKEVFCKNWQSFRLGVEWKDRPVDFEDYYEAYNLEDGVNISTNVFEIRGGVLDKGIWEDGGVDKRLFTSKNSFTPCPAINGAFNFNGYRWNRGDFPITAYEDKSMPKEPLTPLTVNSSKAFFRIKLKGEDFQHDSYAFVLAKQMMALANILDPKSIETIKEEVDNIITLCDETEDRIDDIKTWGGTLEDLQDEVEKAPPPPIFAPPNIPSNIPGNLSPYGLEKIDESLCSRADKIKDIFIANNADNAILPNEPYTPVIKSLFVDYKAEATISDMDITHLYPFENTSKFENIETKPTLFPFFNDEGTLFIGLEKITIGGSLSLLFQLAEATADSELDRAEIYWHYLSNNEWKLLQYDFDVISDETDRFTVSGIASIVIPDDITNKGNTVMPDPLYWVKVSTPKNVKAVAETIGIHTQAAKTSARFSVLNDKNRLETPLEPGSIAKLVNGDFNVKKVEQIYPSFGGRTPEVNGHFYTRVSEQLKHKGRALMLSDYEKIVLEGFPEIEKAKCITHTMGLSAIDYKRDLEVAPGYIVITVIPDLTKLESGNLIAPKVPVSLLEKIGDYVRKRTSPFARIKIMNPRYEGVDVVIKVRLHRGKSPDFFTKKLKDDITLFLAPWVLGDIEKLAFGQLVRYSDIIGFVEQLQYVDFIVNLELTGLCNQKGTTIKPLTARTVLVPGNICIEHDKETCLEAEATHKLKSNKVHQLT